MNKYKKIIMIAAIGFALCAFRNNYSKNEEIFKQLFALEGTWKTETRKGALYEHWVKTSDKTMQQKSYRLKDADTIRLESVLLQLEEDGIFYIPTVPDQNNSQPVRFKLSSSENHSFVFENPTHDYPKRVVYNIISADSIYAYTDAGADTKRSNFYYQKVH